MRAFLITLVLALVAVLAMAEVQAPACTTPQQGAATAPNSLTDWARLQGFQVEPSPRSTDFACPAIFNNCTGVNCSAGFGTTSDTGETSCEGDGFAVLCAPGKTIHVSSGPCVRAHCCTHPPFCLCGPCSGGWQTWRCA